jgi:hypothetical protein
MTCCTGLLLLLLAQDGCAVETSCCCWLRQATAVAAATQNSCFCCSAFVAYASSSSRRQAGPVQLPCGAQLLPCQCTPQLHGAAALGTAVLRPPKPCAMGSHVLLHQMDRLKIASARGQPAAE